MDATIVKKIGKYEVTGVLGRGGMGVVYRAEDRRIGRSVAIKTLTEGYTGQPDALKRFYAEAQAGILQHPNIVTVYDLGDEDGVPFIVMEFVQGDPLDKLLASGRKLPLADKVSIIEQVCLALDYAHRQAVVHRDIKPGNVIVQPDGRVKIVDFGIARLQNSNTNLELTGLGQVIGSVHYIPPERFQGKPFDGRADIFAAGVMLYLLLTGELPFPGDPLAAQYKIVYEPYPPLSKYLGSYPRQFDEIFERALAKDPHQRYATAGDFATDLRAIREELEQGRVAQLFSDAERLTSEQQFGPARELLQQLVRIDAQHTGARQLLGIVQQNMSRLQRADQVKQLVGQADEAMASGRLPDAIATLQQAMNLDPSSPTVKLKLDIARDKKRQQEEIAGLLTEAEEYRGRGDITGALRALERALPLDPTNTGLRSVHAIVVKEVKLADQRRQVRGLLDQARQEVSARQFTQAIAILREAGQVDPSQQEVEALLQAALAGQELERRRRLLEQIHSQVDQCVATADFERAAEAIASGLQQVPGDSSLLRLKAEVEQHAHAFREEQQREREQEERRREERQREEQREQRQREETLRATQAAAAAQQQEVDSVVGQVSELRAGGGVTEAIRLLQAQPVSVTSDPKVAQLQHELLREVEAREAKRQSAQAAVQSAAQEAGQALQRGNYTRGWETLQAAQRDLGDSEALRLAMEDYQKKCMAAAGLAADDAMAQARSAIRNKDAENAVRILNAATGTFRFAGAQQQEAWRELAAQAAEAAAEAKAELDARIRAQMEAKAEAESQARADALAAEQVAKEKAEAEAEARAAAKAAEAAAKAKAEAESRAKAEAESQARAAAKAAEAAAKAKAEAESRAKAEAESQARAAAKAAEAAEKKARKQAAEAKKAKPGGQPAAASAIAGVPEKKEIPKAALFGGIAAVVLAAAGGIWFFASGNSAKTRQPATAVTAPAPVNATTAAATNGAATTPVTPPSANPATVPAKTTASAPDSSKTATPVAVPAANVPPAPKVPQPNTAAPPANESAAPPPVQGAIAAAPPGAAPGELGGTFTASDGTNQSADHLTIQPGKSVHLAWDIVNANGNEVSLNRQKLPAKSQIDESLDKMKTYTLIASGKKGQPLFNKTITINIDNPSLHAIKIESFDANKKYYPFGEPATLVWKSNAKSVSIDGFAEGLPASGQREVPTHAGQNKFTLRAIGLDGKVATISEVYVMGLPQSSSSTSQPGPGSVTSLPAK